MPLPECADAPIDVDGLAKAIEARMHCVNAAAMATPPYIVTQELLGLVDILADWIAPAPSIPAVYLFGSRVRGDHRPDSDVDVRLFLNEWGGLVDERDLKWWDEQNITDFAELKTKLRSRLAIHRETPDQADAAILAERKAPLLTHRRVVCVITQEKAQRGGLGRVMPFGSGCLSLLTAPSRPCAGTC